MTRSLPRDGKLSRKILRQSASSVRFFAAPHFQITKDGYQPFPGFQTVAVKPDRAVVRQKSHRPLRAEGTFLSSQQLGYQPAVAQYRRIALYCYCGGLQRVLTTPGKLKNGRRLGRLRFADGTPTIQRCVPALAQTRALKNDSGYMLPFSHTVTAVIRSG